MKIAVMQPYLFPYLGYFQLIAWAERFVVYDDVSYRKGGFINRNYIRLAGNRHLFTLQVRGASPGKRIDEVGVGGNRYKLLKTLRQAYGSAPFRDDVMPIVEATFRDEEANLARFVTASIRRVVEYLELETELLVSSELGIGTDLRGQDRVLAIVRSLGGTQYLNAIGGRELYDRSAFADAGIELSFLRTRPTPYDQSEGEFIPNLSILDVLMFNDRKAVGRMLTEFDRV